MNYRQATIVPSESINTAGTKEVDIFKLKDVVSRLLIQVKGTNNGSTPTAHPAKMVSDIKLVDGSDVLWELSGIEAQALNFYQQGKPSINITSYVNDNSCVALYAINFGRWLWDEDLAFDPKRFKMPQLKITHNKASGGSAPDAGTMEVIADCFDEIQPNPIGFLSAKEHYSYSLTSSAYETVDLPTDAVIRMLMVQSLSADKQPWEQYNELRLSEENQKRIPIDQNTSDLIKYVADQFGTFEENIYCESSTSEVTHYCAPTYETHLFGSEQNKQASYPIFTQSYGGTFVVDASAVGQLKLRASGYCPHGALALPFGDLWDANKWWDVTKLGALDLRIKAGSSVGSSSTCQVITEQLRRY